MFMPSTVPEYKVETLYSGKATAPKFWRGYLKKRCVHISAHQESFSGTVLGHQVWTQPSKEVSWNIPANFQPIPSEDVRKRTWNVHLYVQKLDTRQIGKTIVKLGTELLAWGEKRYKNTLEKSAKIEAAIKENFGALSNPI